MAAATVGRGGGVWLRHCFPPHTRPRPRTAASVSRGFLKNPRAAPRRGPWAAAHLAWVLAALGSGAGAPSPAAHPPHCALTPPPWEPPSCHFPSPGRSRASIATFSTKQRWRSRHLLSARMRKPQTSSAPPPWEQSPGSLKEHTREGLPFTSRGLGARTAGGGRRETCAAPRARGRAPSQSPHPAAAGEAARDAPRGSRGRGGGRRRAGSQARGPRPREPAAPSAARRGEPGRAPAPLPGPRAAACRAGSRAGGPRAAQAGAGELRVASRHLASPCPACFPDPRPAPARRRGAALRVRPFPRFEFSPADTERQVPGW